MPLFLANLSAKFFQLLPKPLLTEDQLRLLKYDNIVSKKYKTNFDLKIHPSGTAVIFTYDKNATRSGITRMLSALSKNNIIVKDLQTYQSTLEEVFLSLINKAKK